MRKIVLVRHAKSSWEYNLTDHERPLNSRGINDAHLVSKAICGRIDPNLILSSDAVRAKTTAKIFISNLNIHPDNLVLNHSLYDFSGHDLLKVIKDCNDSVNELMIFGHNNAITNFVNAYGNMHIDNVPTCGVTVLEFEIESWKDLKKGRTVETLFPRDLKS